MRRPALHRSTSVSVSRRPQRRCLKNLDSSGDPADGLVAYPHPNAQATVQSGPCLNSELFESQIHAIPGRCEHDLMYCRALWQIANEFDGLREIFRLEHSMHVFFRRLRCSRLEDFRRDLAR